MRRLFIIMLAVVIMACHTDAYAAGKKDIGRTLIAYYSYTGDCRAIVSELAGQAEADVLEILPAEKGLKYDADGYILGTQLLSAIKADPYNADSYPAIDPTGEDLSCYDNIIIVTPLWWSQMAAIMQTYLFSNADAIAGKRVSLIVSSHSSPISGVEADLRRLLPNATWTGSPLWINSGNRSNTDILLGEWLNMQEFNTQPQETMKINITIDSRTMTATLADNSSARALYEALCSEPMTYEAHDYGNFEKVGTLSQSFPQNNEQITTQPGDIILYQGNSLCIYYDTNTWTFTRIGKIDNATQQDIKDFVKAGQGNVSITLAVSNATAISTAQDKNADSGMTYTAGGMRADSTAKGILIKDGKAFVSK